MGVKEVQMGFGGKDFKSWKWGNIDILPAQCHRADTES